MAVLAVPRSSAAMTPRAFTLPKCAGTLGGNAVSTLGVKASLARSISVHTTGNVYQFPKPFGPEASWNHVVRFAQRLGLPKEAYEERLRNTAQNALSYFRATPSLFVLRLRPEISKVPAPHVPILLDPHLGNFGTFTDPQGNVVWGINDYDQAGIGSPLYDLLRMTTSAVLVARAVGESLVEQRALADRLTQTYWHALARDAAAPKRRSPWLALGESTGPVADLIREYSDPHVQEKASATIVVRSGKGRTRLENEARFEEVSPSLAAQVYKALLDYARDLPAGTLPNEFKVDVRRKLHAGGSSLGLDRFEALVRGQKHRGLPLVLELKRLLPSALDSQDGDLSQADARRIVSYQRQLGGMANVFTGATRLNGGWFLVRQVEPEKATVKLTKLSPQGLEQVATQAAQLLARAHTQSPEGARALGAWAGAMSAQPVGQWTSLSIAEANRIEADVAFAQRALQLPAASPR